LCTLQRLRNIFNHSNFDLIGKKKQFKDIKLLEMVRHDTMLSLNWSSHRYKVLIFYDNIMSVIHYCSYFNYQWEVLNNHLDLLILNNIILFKIMKYCVFLNNCSFNMYVMELRIYIGYPFNTTLTLPIVDLKIELWKNWSLHGYKVLIFVDKETI
jgi:hypothetical protein